MSLSSTTMLPALIPLFPEFELILVIHSSGDHGNLMRYADGLCVLAIKPHQSKAVPVPGYKSTARCEM